MQMIYRFITLVLCRTFKGVIDELNLDWQRVHEWTSVNGIKLNPIKKSGYYLISRCRVDIPPLTLLIGSDDIKVVPKAHNLGFVLNERVTATDHFKEVCQKLYWILHSLRPHHIHRLKLGEGWLCHLFCLTLDMRVLCMLVWILHHNGG
jgi:hypothetical protein